MNLRFIPMPVRLASVFGLAALIFVGRAQEQPAPELVPATIIKSQNPGDLFALSVATDSQYLLIGAPVTDGIKGAVHLYYKGPTGLDDWREHQVLRPTYPTPTTLFGFSIALGHNAAAISAYHSPVFVFERVELSEDWEQTAALETPDDTEMHGDNMCMNEGTLAIGVTTFGTPVDEAGCVLIYQRDPSRAWHYVRRVQAEDPEESAFFGSSVALLGDYMVVGAPGVAASSGAVYVFKRDAGNWRQVQKILPPAPIPNGEFGHSVTTNIGQIIISEPGDGELSNTPGRVFLYELPGIVLEDHWNLKDELVPNEPLRAKSRFGHKVGIDGNNRDVVVTQFPTASTVDTQAPGSAYVFTIGLFGWKQRLRLAPTANEPPNSFGVSLAVGSVHAVVGDYGTTTKPGAAYVYDLTLPQTPPVFLDAPENLHVNAPAGQSAEVTLEVIVADENGADLDVRWLVDGVEVESDFVDGGYPFTQGNVSFTTTLTPGVHRFRVVADERATDLEAEHTFTVTVGDAEGPAIQSVTATPSIIPAQHGRFVLVRVNVQATDPSGPVSWKITSVESSDTGARRPHQLPDWIITPNKHSVRLRAASGEKTSRIYTIHVEARDSLGNVSEGETTVTVVPKLNKPGRQR
jgi:hypothetical protein